MGSNPCRSAAEENFSLLQCQVFVPTLISVSVPAPCYRSSTSVKDPGLSAKSAGGRLQLNLARTHLTYVALHEATWCMVV